MVGPRSTAGCREQAKKISGRNNHGDTYKLEGVQLLVRFKTGWQKSREESRRGMRSLDNAGHRRAAGVGNSGIIRTKSVNVPVVVNQFRTVPIKFHTEIGAIFKKYHGD